MQGIKVWGAVIFAAAFVALVAATPRFSPRRAEVLPPLSLGEDKGGIPENAFLSGQRDRLAPASAIPSFDVVSLPQLIASTTPNTGLVIVPRVREAAPIKAQSAPARSLLLPLPNIEERELAVGVGGAQGFEDFAQAIIDSRAAFFDGARFATILEEPDGIPYSITDLMKMGFAPGKWAAVESSLHTLKEFVDARTAYVKTVRVSGDAVEFARTMVAFDTLTSMLLGEVIANGGKPSEALQKKVAAYEATGTYYNWQIAARVGVLAKSNPTNIFDALGRFLALVVPPVHAQIGGRTPFGGKITYRMDCTVCNRGFIIRLNNAVNKSPLTLFISWATFGSPLFYINKNPNVSQNILGLYNKSSGKCEQPVCKGKCCPVDRYDGKLYMAGTS